MRRAARRRAPTSLHPSPRSGGAVTSARAPSTTAAGSSAADSTAVAGDLGVAPVREAEARPPPPTAPAAAAVWRWPQPETSAVSGQHLYRDFVSEAEEAQLLHDIEADNAANPWHNSGAREERSAAPAPHHPRRARAAAAARTPPQGAPART